MQFSSFLFVGVISIKAQASGDVGQGCDFPGFVWREISVEGRGECWRRRPWPAPRVACSSHLETADFRSHSAVAENKILERRAEALTHIDSLNINTASMSRVVDSD